MYEVTCFWERLNSLIKHSNTTQNEVSVRCGLNPRRLQNLSAGSRLPDCFEAVAIADALGTTVEFLVAGKDPQDKKEIIKEYLEELIQSL